MRERLPMVKGTYKDFASNNLKNAVKNQNNHESHNTNRYKLMRWYVTFFDTCFYKLSLEIFINIDYHIQIISVRLDKISNAKDWIDTTKL